MQDLSPYEAPDFEMPRFEKSGDSYNFSFFVQNIHITFDRVEPIRSALRGELRITALRGDTHYRFDGDCEITSAVHRDRLALALTQNTPGLPWGKILEVVAVKIQESYWKGNPWMSVADMEAPDPEVQYLVKPLLERNTSTLLFADGGSGKSFVAAVLSLIVSSGHSMGGMIATCAPSPVAYLDWESSAEMYQRRILGLTATMGIAPPEGLIYRSMAGKLGNHVNEIKRFVDANGVQLVIIDSAAFASGEADSTADATRLFEHIREIGMTTLVIGHVPKSDASRPFGSVYMRNGPRNVWKLERDDDANPKVLTLAAKHMKTNNGPLLPPIAWQFRFEDGGYEIHVEKVEADMVDAVAKTKTIAERIEDLMAENDGAMWNTEITEQMPLDDKQSIGSALRRGEGTKFTRLAYGPKKTIQWGLLDRSFS